METSKQVLDRFITGMPDDDCMKKFILKAMEEYADIYHKYQLKKVNAICDHYCPRSKDGSLLPCEFCKQVKN
tara:strand:- start:512 stop:727 length:216 start_codon:yes stop_codon:yes gene_type:complete